MATQYKRLLVALDGSELAGQILSHARPMAAAFGAKLILFRVVPEVQPEFDYAILADRFIHPSYRHVTADTPQDPRQKHLIIEADRTLTCLMRELEAEGIQAEVVLKMGSDPAEKIIDYATTHNVDMILMSTHGRTGLAHLVYGSVAEVVLRRAPCPVFLLRSVVDE